MIQFVSAILVLISLSPNALAEGVLQIPVFIEGGIHAEELNRLLSVAGAKPIPTVIEVSTNEDGTQKFRELDSKIEKALARLGSDYEYLLRQIESVPGSNNRPGYETCYKGQAVEIADIVSSLADAAYSDQLSLWGWKYQNLKKLAQKKVQDRFLSEKSKRWREWKGLGEEILILSAVGDSGTDVHESLIKRCP